MAKHRMTFRGLYSKIYPNALPSGAADSILNTVFEGTSLQGRKGFALWDANTGSAIRSLYHVRFANGNGYNVKKVADGYLYFQAETGGDWTKIATLTSESSAQMDTTDAGWFYFWHDRLYYHDRSGTLKWHPVDGTWRAGVYSSVGAGAMTAAAGGEKEGYYHVHIAKWNDVTNELSSVAGPQSPGITTRQSENKGGFTVDNIAAIHAADLDYEWKRVVGFVTKGDTEYSGLGTGAEKFSHVAYWDVDVAKGAGAMGFNKADSVLDREQRFTNAGGLPPSSRFGYFDGSQAVYLDVYAAGGGAAEYGKLMFSLPRFPTMVPQRRNYSQGGDSKTFVPKPWEGLLSSILPGAIVGVAGVGRGRGRRYVVFTTSGVYWLVPLIGGRLYPVEASKTLGGVSEKGTVWTPRSVHTLSRNAWLRVTERGLENIAHNRFDTTLEALPADLTGAVAGYYNLRNEVWMAVPNASGYVQDLLIWDESRNEIVSTWSVAGIGVVSITAMMEVPTATGPVMLLGLSDGRILKWPGTTYKDPGPTGYAAHWQGYVGQERRMYDQHLLRLGLHATRLPSSDNGLTLGAAGLRTAAELGDTVTMVEKIIKTKEDLVDQSGVEFDPNTDGNLFAVKISSTVAQGADWSVDDMILDLDRITK